VVGEPQELPAAVGLDELVQLGHGEGRVDQHPCAALQTDEGQTDAFAGGRSNDQDLAAGGDALQAGVLGGQGVECGMRIDTSSFDGEIQEGDTLEFITEEQVKQLL
jgi:hypothetical protein